VIVHVDKYIKCMPQKVTRSRAANTAN